MAEEYEDESGGDGEESTGESTTLEEASKSGVQRESAGTGQNELPDSLTLEDLEERGMEGLWDDDNEAIRADFAAVLEDSERAGSSWESYQEGDGGDDSAYDFRAPARFRVTNKKGLT